MNGHEYDECGSCKKCFLDKFSINFHIKEYTCSEIIKIAKTHTWGLKDHYLFDAVENICFICNMPGVLIKDRYSAKYYHYIKYTCNEYLMIKANE